MKKINQYILLFSILLSTVLSEVNASEIINQDSLKTSKNNIHVESFLIFIQSINYENNIYKSNLIQLNGRYGIAYQQIEFFGVTESIGGIGGLTFLLGRKRGHLETLIAGFIPFQRSGALWPIIELGYRYQNPNGGFLFRTFLGTTGIGIGLGYGF